MPLQNRVTPDQKIVAQPWYGTMMGNRGGRIHDPSTKRLLSRQWASKRWICCVLEFKGRQRQVMGTGYTELFFLDEVSAMAAGHRPCFECQRARANLFAGFWARAVGPFSGSRADEMDRVLHKERVSAGPTISADEIEALPDGGMVKSGDRIFAVKAGRLLYWSGDGYVSWDDKVHEAILLTPASMIKVLELGYLPGWHESAL